MPDALRVVIADDEELARALLRRYLKKDRDVTVVAECANGDELAEALGHADVALVDVRMPGRDVFEVLGAADELPAIVFTTAFDQYAVRAFELNAVDYLLKPVTEPRLAQALERVRTRQERANEVDLHRLLRDLGPRPDRILVPHRDGMVPVAVSDILWIKAEGDYARIHTAQRSYLVTRMLTEIEERLDPAHFLRIHRSAIIRTDKIAEVKGEGSSRYRVVLEDGTQLIVSRTRAPMLKRWMI
jgi:two-component system, LytTR family, response regulator